MARDRKPALGCGHGYVLRHHRALRAIEGSGTDFRAYCRFPGGLGVAQPRSTTFSRLAAPNRALSRPVDSPSPGSKTWRYRRVATISTVDPVAGGGVGLCIALSLHFRMVCLPARPRPDADGLGMAAPALLPGKQRP